MKFHYKKNKTKTNQPEPEKKHISFLTTVCFLQAKLKTEINKEARILISETYLISCSSEILNNSKRR